MIRLIEKLLYIVIRTRREDQVTTPAWALVTDEDAFFSGFAFLAGQG